jgi:hypothetical protein
VPLTVAELFKAAGLVPQGVVCWGERIPEEDSGVYVVAFTADINALEARPGAAISMPAIRHLLDVRPELALNGKRPSAWELGARIGAFWLPDETIVYIGKATSLNSRVGSYCRTKLGAKKPHAGGWWLKVLRGDMRAELQVHYARVKSPDLSEDAMMGTFCEHVSKSARAALPDPDHPFPFANLEWHTKGRKLRKAHGIRGATGELPRL